MASVKNIEIEINKEVAKQAYEAGARWAFGDDDGILTIEGFDKYWADLQERVMAISSNESAVLPLHGVSNNEVACCGNCHLPLDNIEVLPKVQIADKKYNP